MHDTFRTVAQGLVTRLTEQGYTKALMNQTITTKADWLIMHIKDADLRLAIYIQQADSEDNYC